MTALLLRHVELVQFEGIGLAVLFRLAVGPERHSTKPKL